jgi:hypothetical protein
LRCFEDPPVFSRAPPLSRFFCWGFRVLDSLAFSIENIDIVP